MSRAIFIQDLVELLLRLERGMQEFETPLPQQTEESLITAVAAFGDEALPTLLTRFTDSFTNIGHGYIGHGYIIEVLERIGNPAAVPALIAFHQNYGNYDSRAGAMSALRKLDTEQAYTYMSEVLTRYALGNTRVVDSPLELVIACRALGEWGDLRAIPPLMAAAQIHHEPAGMPQAAIQALGRYPAAQKFLAKLASQNAPSDGGVTDEGTAHTSKDHDHQPEPE
jgi:hypothetical protein